MTPLEAATPQELAQLHRETAILLLKRGRVATVDADQYEIISRHAWHVTTHGYVARRFIENGKRKIEYLHRRIINAPVDMCVDHIDRNKLNNILQNLRICTKLQNSQNTTGRTGKYKGVSYEVRLKKEARWVARINYMGVNKYLGRFATEVEAALAYDEAAKRIQGEFAFLNLPAAERLDYTLTISGPSAAPTTVTLDGLPCTVQRALAITRLAQETGRFERVAT